MASPTPTFTLQPATRADIPRLAQIHVDACMPDNAFKLYFSSPAEFFARVTDMLNGQLEEPNWTHIKAIDNTTGRLAAWASWYSLPDAELLFQTKATEVEQEGSGKGEINFPPGLAQFVQADSEAWLNRWTRGRRHMRTLAMFTDPVFQRRGMGSAMVAYGNRLADDRGLPIFLWASAYGYPRYRETGFETVQHLDVDLTKWAPGAEGGDKGFGNYRFRYMVRLPVTAREESK